jgi:hypothetical protein
VNTIPTAAISGRRTWGDFGGGGDPVATFGTHQKCLEPMALYTIDSKDYFGRSERI